MSSVPLLIAGDFNIHVDVPGNAEIVCLKELLEFNGPSTTCKRANARVRTHPGFDHYSTMRLLIG